MRKMKYESMDEKINRYKKSMESCRRSADKYWAQGATLLAREEEKAYLSYRRAIENLSYR